MFNVIKKTNPVKESEHTWHIRKRAYRVQVAEELIEEENATIMGAWEVDTGCFEGHEIHNVYDNGIIKIFNQNSGRYVTTLIGRMAQVKRYGIEPSRHTKERIREHVALALNEI